MKKISLLVLGIFCLLLTGCGDNETKEVGTLDNFKTLATNNGFTIIENLINYEDASYITGSIQAISSDIVIEMVTYDTEENAKKAQDKQITNFKSIKASGATADIDKGKNFYRFSMISNGYYMVNSRIDNTLIFSKTLVDNKDKIETILNDMGY